ncbi:hypothetical protein [Burkholderia pseudomultivorans]|uniref:hypothetical protein n=1 Tax=Burkholderia pseudomultivorans TaxID=1207504 RepID=UPI0018C6A119|nr:hypothetical protein [Burkholderia pseudomultivorans]
MTIDKIGRACRTAIASADEDNRAPQALCIFRRCGAVADFYRVHYLHASIQGDTLDFKNEKPQPIPQHSPSVARHGPIGAGVYSDFKRLRRRAKKNPASILIS